MLEPIECCYSCPYCDTTLEICRNDDYETGGKSIDELSGPIPAWCPLPDAPEQKEFIEPPELPSDPPYEPEECNDCTEICEGCSLVPDGE